MAIRQNTVAIIDDDPGIRDALEHLLSSHGYHTELYPSAEEFISAVHLTKALCLVVDVQLGGISGLELGRHLFADGFNIPIIFMTGSRDEAIRRQASDFGCAAFLRKPFVAAQLVEAITKAIDTALDWK